MQKLKLNGHFIAYILILLFAFGTYVSSFDFGLPYIGNVDSPNFYLVVNDDRGLLDAQWRNDLLAGYPLVISGYIIM